MFICIKFISIYVNIFDTKLNDCQFSVIHLHLTEDEDFLRSQVKKSKQNTKWQ